MKRSEISTCAKYPDDPGTTRCDILLTNEHAFCKTVESRINNSAMTSVKQTHLAHLLFDLYSNFTEEHLARSYEIPQIYQ